MSLKDLTSEDIKKAMQSQDQVNPETVHSVKKVLLKKEVDARGKGQDSLTGAWEMEVLIQVAKQCGMRSLNKLKPDGRIWPVKKWGIGNYSGIFAETIIWSGINCDY